jgi:hypothetical protein
MALDKLKYTYQDPAKVSELNVDDVLNVTNTINTTNINTTNVNSKSQIISPVASSIGLTLKSATLPNSDLMQLQDNVGSIKFGINSAGNIYSGTGPTFAIGNTNYILSSAIATSSTTATFVYALGTQPLFVGQQVQISSVTPNYFNGVWTVTSVSGGPNQWLFTVLGSGFTPGGVGTGFGILRPSPQLSITSTNALNTPFVIQAHPLQNANLIEFLGTSGSRVGYVSASGNLFFSGNMNVQGTSFLTVIADQTATSAQITPVGNSISTYNSSGVRIRALGSNQQALTVRSTISTATISAATANGTTITYTNNNSQFFYPGMGVTITGVVSTGNPSATAGSGFNLTNATVASANLSTFTVTNSLVDTYTSGGLATATTTADIQQWQDSGGGTIAKVTYTGGAQFTGNTVISGGLSVSGNYGGSTTMAISNNQNIIGLTISGINGQTADLQQWRDYLGTNLVAVNSSGSIYSPSTELILQQTGDTYGTTRLRLQSRTGLSGALFENAGLDLVDFGFKTSSNVTGLIRYENRVGFTVSGVSEFQIGTGGTIASTPLAITGTNVASSTGRVIVNSTGASIIPLTVKAATAQSANLTQWQDSTANPISAILYNGSISISRTAAYYFNNGTVGNERANISSNSNNELSFQITGGSEVAHFYAGTSPTNAIVFNNVSGYATANVFVIKGAGGQSGDYLQIQNGSGTVLSKIDNVGNFTKGDGDQLVLASQVF